MSRFVTIDFEASCLPRHGRSFPIEVGIAELDGVTRSWLIRPHDDWSGWTWTAEAENLHQISRDQLERDGLPVTVVMEQIAGVVAGSRIIADSNLDCYWMETLAEAAGCTAPPVETVNVVLEEIGTIREDVLRAEAEEAVRPSRRHYAGDDAQRLARLLGSLKRQATQRAIGMRPEHRSLSRTGDLPTARIAA